MFWQELLSDVLSDEIDLGMGMRLGLSVVLSVPEVPVVWLEVVGFTA